MERRNFTRVPFQSRAVVSYEGKNFEGEVKNLSLNGMLLQVAERLPLDEEVEIKMFLSGTSSELSLNLKGKVSRHEYVGLAFHFTGMDLDSFTHLRNIVAYNTDEGTEVMEEFFRFMKRGGELASPS